MVVVGPGKRFEMGGVRCGGLFLTVSVEKECDYLHNDNRIYRKKQ